MIQFQDKSLYFVKIGHRSLMIFSCLQRMQTVQWCHKLHCIQSSGQLSTSSFATSQNCLGSRWRQTSVLLSIYHYRHIAWQPPVFSYSTGKHFVEFTSLVKTCSILVSLEFSLDLNWMKMQGMQSWFFSFGSAYSQESSSNGRPIRKT